MANTTDGSPYHKEMDGPAHEAMYRKFQHFTEVGATFVACIVVGLAIGGAKHAWLSAVAMIILAHIATAIGLFSPKIAWRAPAVVLGLLFLMLIFY